MNRLKLSNRLIHDCHRSVYSISAYVHSLDLRNVNNAKFHGYIEEKLCAPPNNGAIEAKKFVYLGSNKNSTFGGFGGLGNCGLRSGQTFALAAPNFSNHGSIRHFSDSAGVPIVTPVEISGFWKYLSESPAVEFCQNSLVSFHVATGLPWWATIVLATWSIRAAITLPLMLYQNYINAKVENLKYEMDDIVKELKMETNYAVDMYKWTEAYARNQYNQSVKKEWQKLIERENCHPMKGVVVLIIQIPMWIVVSTSLRNLCYMLPYPTGRAQEIYLELTTGGFGWVTNLTVVDPYYVIPIALGLLNLSIVEMQTFMRTREATRRQRYWTNFFRVISVAMIPLATYVPASISLYWASSSAFGVIQNLTVISPRVRRLVRIPPTDSELEEPYRHMYRNFRRRIGLKETPLPGNVKKL